VYVVYGGEPELFLTRLVAGHFVGQDWIVITPLFDAFEGDVSLADLELEALFMCLIAAADLVGFVRSRRGNDARVLSIARVHGSRHREWREAMHRSKQTDFPDFPVVKPRMARWCADYLVKDEGLARHLDAWQSDGRLQVTVFGVDIHEILSKITDFLGPYEQHDLVSPVSCEPFFRTLQLIEYFYDEEDPDSMNQDTRLSVEEARAVTRSLAQGLPGVHACP
jgi:hypothetical protein